MTSAQASLFGDALPAGVSLVEALVEPGEEAELIRRSDASGLEPFRFHRWTGKRLTRSFGWHYAFGGGGLRRTDPIPEWLLPLRCRAAQAAGLDAELLVHALLTRYDPGAAIGWHRDRPQFDHVIGISLGAPATLQFRRRRADGGFDRARLPLPPRSLYRLDGPARWDWEHGIAPAAETRWSVTFRSLRQASSGQ